MYKEREVSIRINVHVVEVAISIPSCVAPKAMVNLDANSQDLFRTKLPTIIPLPPPAHCIQENSNKLQFNFQLILMPHTYHSISIIISIILYVTLVL